MRNKRWMGRLVGAVEVTCWAGIIVSAMIAGQFDTRFTIIAVAMLLATAGFICWRVHHDRRSTHEDNDATDTLPEQ